MIFNINWKVLFRKRHYTNEKIAETNLLRVLGLFDVSAIGK
jgi:hypothetical protein